MYIYAHTQSWSYSPHFRLGSQSVLWPRCFLHTTSLRLRILENTLHTPWNSTGLVTSHLLSWVGWNVSGPKGWGRYFLLWFSWCVDHFLLLLFNAKHWSSQESLVWRPSWRIHWDAPLGQAIPREVCSCWYEHLPHHLNKVQLNSVIDEHIKVHLWIKMFRGSKK